MKTINTYINEKLRLSAKRTYTCQPKSKDELKLIIVKRIVDEGPNCDLNDIDVSKITDMSELFDAYVNPTFKYFNGDISMWNVSNVDYMSYMFEGCKQFNCDISKWNVSNVKYMDYMFYDCKKFDCDLSKWDVSNVVDMYSMFDGCKKFNQDLDSWNVSKAKNYLYNAFTNCPTKPTWYDRKQWEY